MAMYPKPPAPKKSVSASRQTGGKAKESMPGVRGSGEMMALKGTGKTKPKIKGSKAKKPMMMKKSSSKGSMY